MAALAGSPAWPLAHWIALPTLVTLAWALWLLVGWPALAMGLTLVVVGVPGSAPLPVAALGAIGGVALALAGVLVQGAHMLSFGPLFLGGVPLALWIVWAGLRAARGTAPGAAVRAAHL